MNTSFDIQKRLIPDLFAVIQKRVLILRAIRHMQPVGRRMLAQQLGMTERVLRSEVEFLQDQNLVFIRTSGMTLTEDGSMVAEEMESMLREISGIDVMESKMRDLLGIQKVIIVNGNSDQSSIVKEELGRATARCMKKLLDGKNIIAVTGGSTMATIAEMLSPDVVGPNTFFVPARGGIGENVKNQANSICATMAERTKAKHRALYVPDQVSSKVYDSMIKEPVIEEILSLIGSADMVLHGIGDAFTMAERRKTSAADMDKILTEKAVGEAFGYYFNQEGKIVHKVKTVGLQLKDLSHIPHVLAVAGGSSKAKAIQSYLKSAPSSTILITDEGAAKLLLEGSPF
jgi:central glycolytic genes regulator